MSLDPTTWGWVQDATKAIGGDSQNPGFFGTGQYRADQTQMNLPQLQQMQQAYGQLFQGAQANQAQLQPQQGQLADMLMQSAQGNGPSAAQQLLQQQTQNNIANAYAMSQGQPNNAGAARNIANQAAMANQQAAGQGAAMRAQEQQGAMGMLGNYLTGLSGQNLQAQLGALSGQAGVNQAQQQGQIAGQQINAGGYANAAQGAQKMFSGMMGGISGLGGAVLGMPGKYDGGLIPGYATGGDNPANDTVPAMLSPGEIVLPRSIAQADDAPEKAAAFVQAIRKKYRKAGK